MTRLELLAPARDLECAIAAIDHGADAVYIGGPSFSARKAASNPMAHIERLARHAHRFHARVYLALNTILFEDELEAARKTAHEAWDAGVDGLIVQDMGLLELDLPPVPLIASTQMHNMDPEHVAFLERVGFSRVILARELSLKAIQRIRSAASIELEVFVHGALCVSFSGRCYLSASMGGRSANRGECGQPCRLPWTLRDDRGRPLTQGLHLLSLKDLDRSASIRELIHAGVTAFKIEGRLKDAAYVKNITAFYRRLIDSAISSESGLGKSSSGHCRTSFTPDPRKTFHRGGTPFFLREGDDDIACPITPKSTGEEVGTVRSAGASWFTLEAGPGGIEAGDGICYVDPTGVVRGAKVVGRDGEKILVFGHAEGLVPGVNIMRNHDHRFWRMLKSSTGVRHVEVSLSFGETPRGFRLRATDEDGITGEVVLDNPKVPARDPEAAMAR
ncbi:MAG TPA: peptidase U32 family protein [Deltaproteobacteria bacterium]|nr:peptidase U32 family protein [Deltaproteobacteria bacterium]